MSPLAVVTETAPSGKAMPTTASSRRVRPSQFDAETALKLRHVAPACPGERRRDEACRRKVSVKASILVGPRLALTTRTSAVSACRLTAVRTGSLTARRGRLPLRPDACETDRVSSKGARVGAAARYMAGFAFIPSGVLVVAGIVTDSAVATASGFLLMVGVMLLVGVTYSAVFARDAQLARREMSRRR